MHQMYLNDSARDAGLFQAFFSHAHTALLVVDEKLYVIRGGSWRSRAFESRSFARTFDEIDSSYPDLGFRPAADLPEVK